MDKNRTIISIIVIIVTVAAFIGIGVWFFYPKNVTAATVAGGPVQYVQGGSSSVGAQVPPGAAATLPAGQPEATPAPAAAAPTNSIINQQVLVVDGAGNPVGNDYQIGPDGRLVRVTPPAGPAASPAAAPAVSPAASAAPSPAPSAGVTVSAGSPGAPKAEVTVAKPAAPAAKAPQEAPKAAAKPEPKASAKPAAAAPAPKASAKPEPAKAGAAKPAPAPVVAKGGQEFWIQVISSTSKDRVEQVRKDLAALGFNGRVSSFAKDGKDFYRLRYGPYSERAEAAKFLEWVKMIRGMEGSYIAGEPAGK